MQLTEHFDLEEFLPPHEYGDPPDEVTAALKKLCEDLLEPLRVHFGVPVSITSGWRPTAYNKKAGGVRNSDHVFGRAADIQVGGSAEQSWEDNTVAAFQWLRREKNGQFGQIILEDHRIADKHSTRLWIHVAIPSSRHPGIGKDWNRVLASYQSGKYEVPPEHVA